MKFSVITLRKAQISTERTGRDVFPGRATCFRESVNSVRRVGQLAELSWATRNFESGDSANRVARGVRGIASDRRLFLAGAGAYHFDELFAVFLFLVFSDAAYLAESFQGNRLLRS